MTFCHVLYFISVSPVVRINELDAVVYGVMRVTVRTKIAVRSPRIADDRSTGFDPVTYYGHQYGSDFYDLKTLKICMHLCPKNDKI